MTLVEAEGGTSWGAALKLGLLRRRGALGQLPCAQPRIKISAAMRG